MCRALAIAVLWVLAAPTAHAVLSCTADGTAYCREAGGLSGRALTPAGPMTLEGAMASPVAPPPPTYGWALTLPSRSTC